MNTANECVMVGFYGLGNFIGHKTVEWSYKHPLPTTQEKTLYMDITRWSNTEIRLIIVFAAKDREALYSQQKQDWELTVAQIMNSLLTY